MLRALAVAIGVVLALLLGAGGGITFIVGVYLRRRKVWQGGLWAIAIGFCLLVVSGLYGAQLLVDAASRTDPEQLVAGIIETLRDDSDLAPDDPAQAKRTLESILGDTQVLQGTTVQGVSVPGVLFTYHYFRYTADEQQLLRAVEQSPIDTSWHIASDASCRPGCAAEVTQAMTDTYTPQRNIPGWAAEAVTDSDCYSCFRAPWQHHLLIDRATGTIYHHIGEIRE